MTMQIPHPGAAAPRPFGLFPHKVRRCAEYLAGANCSVVPSPKTTAFSEEGGRSALRDEAIRCPLYRVFVAIPQYTRRPTPGSGACAPPRHTLPVSLGASGLVIKLKATVESIPTGLAVKGAAPWPGPSHCRGPVLLSAPSDGAPIPVPPIAPALRTGYGVRRIKSGMSVCAGHDPHEALRQLQHNTFAPRKALPRACPRTASSFAN